MPPKNLTQAIKAYLRAAGNKSLRWTVDEVFYKRRETSYPIEGYDIQSIMPLLSLGLPLYIGCEFALIFFEAIQKEVGKLLVIDSTLARQGQNLLFSYGNHTNHSQKAPLIKEAKPAQLGQTPKKRKKKKRKG